MLVVPSCSTQEISADPLVIPDGMPSADHGALQSRLRPGKSASRSSRRTRRRRTRPVPRFPRWQAARVVRRRTRTAGACSWSSRGGRRRRLPSGRYVSFRDQDGGRRTDRLRRRRRDPPGTDDAAVFVRPGRRRPGAFRLLSRPPGRGHRACQPDQPGPHRPERRGGGLHGREPVRAAVSALALGETFAADLPMDATQDWPNGRFVTSNGLALGYRQAPTTAVSYPPVYPLSLPARSRRTGRRRRARRWSAAPVYMSPTGDIQASF